jgi:undecaprenyl-diphosphatase
MSAHWYASCLHFATADTELYRFPHMPQRVPLIARSRWAAGWRGRVCYIHPMSRDRRPKVGQPQPGVRSSPNRFAWLVEGARASLPARAQRWLVRVRREAALLGAIALAATSLVLFAQLTDEVVEGETHAFDRAVLLALRNPADPSDPLGPGWLESLMRDITALGSLGVLTLFSLAVVGFLILQGKRHTALLVVLAVGGGMLVSTLTKLGFGRPRPDLVPHATEVYTASFPSGHAMMAAVTYLTLGALVARVQPRRRLKLYLIGLAATLTVMVGVSRVYLGVHWPTDVLAGWALGAAWALACWAIALWLQARGRIEADQPEPEAPPGDGGGRSR